MKQEFTIHFDVTLEQISTVELRPESAEDGLECSQNSFPDMLYCSICHICVAVPIEIIRRDSNTRGPLAAPGENELLKW